MVKYENLRNVVFRRFSKHNDRNSIIMSDYIVVHGIRIAKDFVPETFGRLTTIGPRLALPANKKGHRRWFQVCQCQCGALGLWQIKLLRSGNTSSCGCLQKEMASIRQTKHGRSGSTEHSIWKGIIKRCKNENHTEYARYGGRGISVCPAWDNPSDGFQKFYAYMGPKPTPKHEIDRYPDPNGNYEPGNVRWATRKEQNRNKENNKNLTYNGKTQCVAAWAEELGVPHDRIYSRLRLGWTDEKVLSWPSRKKSK